MMIKSRITNIRCLQLLITTGEVTPNERKTYSMTVMFRIHESRLATALFAIMTVVACVSGFLEPKPRPDVWFPLDVMLSDGYVKGREHDGRISGSPSYASGVFGNALELNMYETTDMVNFGNLRAECVGNPEECPNGFTMATWLKLSPDISTSRNYIISSGGLVEHSWGIALYYLSGQLFAGISTTNWKWTVFTNISLDVWHHIAIVWDAQLGLDLYINGTSMVDDHLGTTFSVDSFQYNDLVLGGSNYGVIRGDYRAACTLDELLFWYRRLSASELHLNFRTGEAILMERNNIISPVNGSPFPKLHVPVDSTLCYDLASGQSQHSLLAEVEWMSDPLGDGATAMVTLTGNNLLDYVDVYMAGKPGDAVTALNKCQYLGTESGNFTLWSRNFACCCGGGSCSKIYLDYQHPIIGCHFLPYSVCWPVLVCSMTAYIEG